MSQDWARYQRMIQLEQLRYEQLRTFATRCNVLTVRDVRGATHAHPAFGAIEQVFLELFNLQKKYMLHLNRSEVDLTVVRMLLKLNFHTGGKAKVNALVRELQGRTLALCHPNFSKSRDSHHWVQGPGAWQNLGAETADPIATGTGAAEYHLQTASHAADGSGREYGFPPTRAVSPSTPSWQSATSTQFPSYSRQSSHHSHQTSLTESVRRPTPIRTFASSPTPSSPLHLASTSWFGSNSTYRSRERDDNCSGPLHREYSSSSSRD